MHAWFLVFVSHWRVAASVWLEWPMYLTERVVKREPLKLVAVKRDPLKLDTDIDHFLSVLHSSMYDE